MSTISTIPPIPPTFQERVAPPGSMPGQPGSGAAFSFGDVLRMVKQRLFLILFLWIISIGITVGATYLLVKYRPQWGSSALIHVESPFPKMPFQILEQPVVKDVITRFLMDQALMVKSRGVLTTALETAKVRATRWYQAYPPDERFMAVENLADELIVTPREGTSFLEVTMYCTNPDDPPVIINTVVEKYINRVKLLSLGSYNEELGEYRNKLTSVDRQLAENRRQQEQFVVNTMTVPGATQGLNVAGEQLRTLTEEASKLETEKISWKAVYDNLMSVQPNEIALSPRLRAMIETDPQIATLSQALYAQEQGLELLERDYGPNHRAVKQARSSIDVVEQQLATLWARKEDEVRRYQINEANMQYLNALQAETAVRERVMEAEAEQRDLDAQLAEYEAIRKDELRLEQERERVNSYLTQLTLLVQQRQGLVRVQQEGQAHKPMVRSSPRWELNVPIGTFLGLVLSIGFALLLELMDTSVKLPRDIVRHVQVPVLGMVPDLDDEEVTIDRIELASYTSPRSMVAEAFRAIRTNLLLSSPAERQRSLLITSPRPEDGKTTVSSNMAISLAQSGRRVLLVDANFRRPTLHRVFNHTAGDGRGLSNVLIGEAKLEELVRKTDLPNLDVLPCGPVPPNPAELLSSSYLRELVVQATDRYDQVLFDGPPVLLVSDALVLAGMVDGVILVCKAKANSRGVVQRARDLLERVNARVFGGILNVAQARRGGYFREQLRTYYDYQLPEAEADAAISSPALPQEPAADEAPKA